MQLNSVYLYPNKIDVFTNASWKTERYRRVYNRNLKLYRSIDNRIDFQVRNSDQKPNDISGTTLVFNIITRDGKDLILQKDCTVASSTLGKVYITITENELNAIESGFYNYSLVQETRTYNGNEYVVTAKTPTYMDSQYGAIGTLEISGDVLGEVEPSLEINKFEYVNPATTGYQDPAYYTSSIIDTKRGTQTPQSLHTLQIYFSNDYQGNVVIQGSLDESSDPNVWFDIPNTEISPGTNNFYIDGESVVYKNVTGKYNWLRVRTGSDRNATASFSVTQTGFGTYNVIILDGGSGYQVGEELTVVGNALGGIRGVNDLIITVDSVNVNGSIVTFSQSGTSINGFKNFVVSPTKDSTVGKVDKILYR